MWVRGLKHEGAQAARQAHGVAPAWIETLTSFTAKREWRVRERVGARIETRLNWKKHSMNFRSRPCGCVD
jgi:hypothetical protein